MKRVVSLVAAGAMLFSMAGVALARGDSHHRSSVRQTSFTHSETYALSDSGENTQTGGGTQAMTTGEAGSSAESLTAGNVNIGNTGRVGQRAFTSSKTGADSVSGLNSQTTVPAEHHHHHNGATTQSMVTGGADSYAGSITVSNVNVSLH